MAQFLNPLLTLFIIRKVIIGGQKGLTECALIEVDLGTVSLEEAGQKLSAKMRQSDFLGELKKGTLYALLANTNSKDAAMVQIRFEEMGFACRIQEEISL